jgi:hypothetical protein
MIERRTRFVSLRVKTWKIILKLALRICKE